MADSHAYLLKSEKIIRTYNSIGAKKSQKIGILHCIFSHIRIIDASTFIKPISHPTFMNAETSHHDLYDELALSTVNLPDMVAGSSEAEDQEDAIYGIPSSLLMLISQTSILADELDTFSIQYPHLSTPQDLAQRARLIENQICAWEQEILESSHGESPHPLFPSQLCPTYAQANVSHKEEALSVSRNVYHAMYFALVVYFFRRVRQTNPILLQSYIELVIENLNAHDQAIKLFNLNAGGIVWPSFIVACEATSADLRRRTLDCLYNNGSHGYRNYESAVRVVKEVWRRRDDGLSNVSWVDVVREWEIRLVLT